MEYAIILTMTRYFFSGVLVGSLMVFIFTSPVFTLAQESTELVPEEVSVMLGEGNGNGRPAWISTPRTEHEQMQADISLILDRIVQLNAKVSSCSR